MRSQDICAFDGAHGSRFIPLGAEANAETRDDRAWIVNTDDIRPGTYRLRETLVPDGPDGPDFDVDTDAVFARGVRAHNGDAGDRVLPSFQRFFVYGPDMIDALPNLADLARRSGRYDAEVLVRHHDGSRVTVSAGFLAQRGWDHRLLFEAWCVRNAWPLLRQILQDLGQKTDDRCPLSVKDVQELYRISEGKPVSRDVFGRYAYAAYELRGKGLVAGGKSQFAITPLGEAFLSRLHPTNRDPKFTDRVVAWSADWDCSEEAAKRWIRTWTGRLRRRMERDSGAG